MAMPQAFFQGSRWKYASMGAKKTSSLPFGLGRAGVKKPLESVTFDRFATPAENFLLPLF